MQRESRSTSWDRNRRRSCWINWRISRLSLLYFALPRSPAVLLTNSPRCTFSLTWYVTNSWLLFWWWNCVADLGCIGLHFFSKNYLFEWNLYANLLFIVFIVFLMLWQQSSLLVVLFCGFVNAYVPFVWCWLLDAVRWWGYLSPRSWLWFPRSRRLLLGRHTRTRSSCPLICVPRRPDLSAGS